MHDLGPIVRLQIQLDRLKQGEEPRRIYDPAPLREMPRLWLSPLGLVAPMGEAFALDVHHAEHPRSRQRRGANAISFGFTGSCARIRERFGPQMWDGIAGENLLVEGEAPTPLALTKGVRILKADGTGIDLHDVIPAPPCAPFAAFALGTPAGPVNPGLQKEVLQFLSRGVRGFYARYAGPSPVVLEPGDRLLALG